MSSRISLRKRNLHAENPLEKAKVYISKRQDQEGFEIKFINDDIGNGTFALRQFGVGEFLLEYRGELVSYPEGMKREEEYTESLASFLYFFEDNKRLNHCIDGTKSTGSARMVNDLPACQANAVMKVVCSKGRPHLCMFAKTSIARGDQVHYDYGGVNLPWRKKSYSIGNLASVPNDSPSGGKIASVPAESPSGGNLASVHVDSPSGGNLASVHQDSPSGDNLASVHVDLPSGGNLASDHDDSPSGSNLASVLTGGVNLPWRKKCYSTGNLASVPNDSPSGGKLASVPADSPSSDNLASVHDESPSGGNQASIHDDSPSGGYLASVHDVSPSSDKLASVFTNFPDFNLINFAEFVF